MLVDKNACQQVCILVYEHTFFALAAREETQRTRIGEPRPSRSGAHSV
jgi:hypothetical protein